MKNDRVLLLGLKDAGKTVLLHQIRLNEVLCSLPTLGFYVETVDMSGKIHPMDVWDLGGQPGPRRLLPFYLESGEVHGLVFVVDGSQAFKEEEKIELRNIVSTNSLKGVPLLLLVNKRDLPISKTAQSKTGYGISKSVQQ